MKKLILFRHAKSNWDGDLATDHQRPLTECGVKAAAIMGRLLADSEQLPERVITSSAVRAQTTVKLASKAGDWHTKVGEIEVTDELYATNAQEMLVYIRLLSDDDNCVLFAGHEPTWSDLTSKLIGGGNIRVPSATMMKINLPVEHWSEVEFAIGKLAWLLRPSLFKS